MLVPKVGLSHWRLSAPTVTYFVIPEKDERCVLVGIDVASYGGLQKGCGMVTLTATKSLQMYGHATCSKKSSSKFYCYATR